MAVFDSVVFDNLVFDCGVAPVVSKGGGNYLKLEEEELIVFITAFMQVIRNNDG